MCARMRTALIRTAYSPNAPRGRDFSCASLVRRPGELIAPPSRQPTHSSPALPVRSQRQRSLSATANGRTAISSSSTTPMTAARILNDRGADQAVFIDGARSSAGCGDAHWQDVGGMFPGSLRALVRPRSSRKRGASRHCASSIAASAALDTSWTCSSPTAATFRRPAGVIFTRWRCMPAAERSWLAPGARAAKPAFLRRPWRRCFEARPRRAADARRESPRCRSQLSVRDSPRQSTRQPGPEPLSDAEAQRTFRGESSFVVADFTGCPAPVGGSDYSRPAQCDDVARLR